MKTTSTQSAGPSGANCDTTPPTLADADVPFIHLEFIWHHANGT